MFCFRRNDRCGLNVYFLNKKYKNEKVYFIYIVTLVAIIMKYNVYISQGVNCLSDMVLTNIETFANNESGSDKKLARRRKNYCFDIIFWLDI